mmetsp:Transcript_3968/g.10345  ORF Transcript_3968/g.10345 Transcript_3968/m.10345 type:complete len:120 (-) Transcript_3968:214-573(-)
MKRASLALLLATLLLEGSAYVLPTRPHAAPAASRYLGTPRAGLPRARQSSSPEPEPADAPASDGDANAADDEAVAEAAAESEEGGGLDVIDSLTLVFGFFLVLNFLGVPLPFSQGSVSS